MPISLVSAAPMSFICDLIAASSPLSAGTLFSSCFTSFSILSSKTSTFSKFLTTSFSLFSTGGSSDAGCSPSAPSCKPFAHLPTSLSSPKMSASAFTSATPNVRNSAGVTVVEISQTCQRLMVFESPSLTMVCGSAPVDRPTRPFSTSFIMAATYLLLRLSAMLKNTPVSSVLTGVAHPKISFTVSRLCSQRTGIDLTLSRKNSVSGANFSP